MTNEEKINELEQEVKALKKERDSTIDTVRIGLNRMLDIPGILPEKSED